MARMTAEGLGKIPDNMTWHIPISNLTASALSMPRRTEAVPMEESAWARLANIAEVCCSQAGVR